MANLAVNDVTVVIPMYNAAATIRRALDSVLAQTTPPARIVVVDDCSTDDSAEVVRGAYPTEVEVVATPTNGGIAVARIVARARQRQNGSLSWTRMTRGSRPFSSGHLRRSTASVLTSAALVVRANDPVAQANTCS